MARHPTPYETPACSHELLDLLGCIFHPKGSVSGQCVGVRVESTSLSLFRSADSLWSWPQRQTFGLAFYPYLSLCSLGQTAAQPLPTHPRIGSISIGFNRSGRQEKKYPQWPQSRLRVEVRIGGVDTRISERRWERQKDVGIFDIPGFYFTDGN